MSSASPLHDAEASNSHGPPKVGLYWPAYDKNAPIVGPLTAIGADLETDRKRIAQDLAGHGTKSKVPKRCPLDGIQSDRKIKNN